MEYAVLNDAQPVPGAPASDLGETSAGIDRNDDRFKDLPRDATIKEQLWRESSDVKDDVKLVWKPDVRIGIYFQNCLAAFISSLFPYFGFEVWQLGELSSKHIVIIWVSSVHVELFSSSSEVAVMKCFVMMNEVYLN